jgi:U3 small nucleolar RNA-associated protein MPP10
MTAKTEFSETNLDDTAILDFVSLLKHPEGKLLALLQENNDPKQIRSVCKILFSQVERYHLQLQQCLLRHSTRKGTSIHPDGSTASLAGIDTLYLGPDDFTPYAFDAETLWGQIDLQNEALRNLLRQQVKKLGTSDAGGIRLLDLGQLTSGDEFDDKGIQFGSSEEEDFDHVLDDETSRIHARMTRTMEEMDQDDDDDTEGNHMEQEEEDASVLLHDIKKEDEPIDPMRELLMDGFFDLHDMEAFADEEEDYLPDEAYEGEKPDESALRKTKKSFHQKQRDGDFDPGSKHDDFSDADTDDELAVQENTNRRKKYRPQDEVDALFQIYDEPEGDDDDTAIDMTAEDFFGKPNMKALERYKPVTMNDDDDADSWDHQDFDDAKGWRDDDKDVDDSDVDEDGYEKYDYTEPNDSTRKAFKEPTSLRQSSKLSKRADWLVKQTDELEREMLAEKPWHMIGEANGAARPVNSLVESTPEFETATKAAPVITVEHSLSIEDIVKKRILVEDWDNVVPRELPDVGWNMKRGEVPEVSQEKSKLGLGELYEREYLIRASGYDKTADEKETEESKAKDEMKALFASLCSKLDALSNYHFAPRPIADEADVRTVSTPAIAMEEVLPLHVSGARGVAPEEVYGANHGRDSVLRGESELTQMERKRLRNSKKAARRKSRQHKLADEKLISRLQPSGVGLANPYEKRKIREELQTAHARGKVSMGQEDATSDYGKSMKFFQRLQSENEKVGDSNAVKRKHADDSLGRSVRSSAYKL